MIIKYKRIIGYVNMCSSVQDHKIKFKVLNRTLFLKEQDHECNIPIFYTRNFK